VPIFNYQGFDAKGRRMTGRMPAETETLLEIKLRDAGVWLLEARPHASAPTVVKGEDAYSGKAGVKRRDLIEFFTLMTFQTRVGLPLVQALGVAAHDCEHPKFRQILAGMQTHIESGLLFHEALEKYPGIFTKHYTHVIRAGEISSRLPEAFDDLRKHLEWTDRVLAEVRQASLYPAIVITVVLGFVIGLFTFVIPKFAALLESVHVKLPLITQIIFGLSHAIKSTWWIWLLTLPAAIGVLLLARRSSKRVALWMDRLKLNLPLFGEINTMLAISRFAHNLAILYRSGIPIVQALQLCQGLVGSPVVEAAVATVEESVKTGSTISEAIRAQPIFPPLLLRMIIMGETTGKLDEALQNVSDYYNEIIPRRIKKLLTTLEPILTIFMIGLVGCVALSIYLPILTLMGTIK
jgi:type II secretory pathway component PulF